MVVVEGVGVVVSFIGVVCDVLDGLIVMEIEYYFGMI